MRKEFLVIIFFLGFFYSGYAEEIIDLGTEGYTCSLSKNESYTPRMKGRVKEARVDLNQNINVSYNAGLNRASGGVKTTKFKINGEIGLSKKVIYVFSALDPYCEQKAQEVKVDSGLCIEFNSLDDISAFREKTKVTWPIQLANKDIVQFLKLKNYPALVTIQGGEIEVKTGF